MNNENKNLITFGFVIVFLLVGLGVVYLSTQTSQTKNYDCAYSQYEIETIPNFEFDYKECQWEITEEYSPSFVENLEDVSIRMESEEGALLFDITYADGGLGGIDECYERDYEIISDPIGREYIPQERKYEYYPYYMDKSESEEILDRFREENPDYDDSNITFCRGVVPFVLDAEQLVEVENELGGIGYQAVIEVSYYPNTDTKQDLDRLVDPIIIDLFANNY